jgi:hypothetical protein
MIFRFLARLFSDSAASPRWRKQSHPAASPVSTRPRDGGAPWAEGPPPAFLRHSPTGPSVRQVRRAPPPPRLEDYAPKPEIDIDSAMAEIAAAIRGAPAPKTVHFDVDGMRDRLLALPRRRLRRIAAAIGADPAELWCFAQGVAA